jgi:hypothetical protein
MTYDEKLKKSAEYLGEKTIDLISQVLRKHDAAIIQVGLEMKARIAELEAERELTINTLELMGKGLAYENVTKAKTQSAGRALMEIARKLRGVEE